LKLKPVNLISKSALKRPLLARLKLFVGENKQLSKLMFLGFLLILFLAATPAFIVHNYKLNVASTKRAIADTKIKFKKLQSQDFKAEKLKADLTKEEMLLKQHLDLLSTTTVKNGGYFGLLLSIPGLMPQDLWINRFVMNDNEIMVSGSTLGSELVSDFMNKLEGCKNFKNTRFISSEKQVIDSHTIYNFQIAMEPSWSQKMTLPGTAIVKAKK